MNSLRALAGLLMPVLQSVSPGIGQDTVNWFQAAPPANPGARSAPGMAYDAARAVTVLFGGGASLSDTWEWDGLNWTERFPAQRPIGRNHAVMAYDEARQKVILFGGNRGSSQPRPNDTWEWDGSNWTQRFPTNAPSPRWGHRMAYDGNLGMVILFGGDAGHPTSTTFNDTWAWDGSDWLPINSTRRPPARGHHGMTFDSSRGRMVIFGGVSASPQLVYFRDTWEFDGVDWTQRFHSRIPTATNSFGMIYDPAMARSVLFGGWSPVPTSLAETWTWDGQEWERLVTSARPHPWQQLGVAYDLARQATVVFGDPNTEETCELHHVPAASFTSFGAGCQGTAGVPSLRAQTSSLPWLGESFSAELRPIPTSAFSIPFLAVGFSDLALGGQLLPIDLSPIGAPGCQVLISIEAAFTLANQGGVASLQIAVPSSRDLAGSTAFLQGFVFDLAANPLGLTSTNGGAMVLGYR